jgi:hypothetical protein
VARPASIAVRQELVCNATPEHLLNVTDQPLILGLLFTCAFGGIITAGRACKRAVPADHWLSCSNRYSVIYRVSSARRADTRTRRIAQFVALLARGETIYPQKRTLDG